MTVSFESARLDALVESARLLQSAKDVDHLLQHLLRSAMAHVLARRGLIARDDGSGPVVVDARGVAGFASGTPFDEGQVRAAGIDHILPIGSEDKPVAWLALGATMSPIRPKTRPKMPCASGPCLRNADRAWWTLRARRCAADAGSCPQDRRSRCGRAG